MKKLYRKGTVHPSPPALYDHVLSFLPAVILARTVVLCPEDKEVLAYLLICSSSSNNFSGNRRRNMGVVVGDHPPAFDCNCFRCYMSYWVRWDCSPNHEVIHQIIDAYEENPEITKTGKNNKKEKRNKRQCKKRSAELKRSEFVSCPSDSVGESSNSGCWSEGEIDCDGKGVVEDEEKGSVRRFVSFIGERIWGSWAQ